MRPRHKAAENLRLRSELTLAEMAASMRPRHKAAENHPSPPDGPSNRTGFNEAAA